ncbi:MAG: type IX secretion system membrane protein PorP/SprF [Bacteroidota bacterium]
MWFLKGKYIALLVTGMFLGVVTCFGQHQPLISQYMLNGLPLNPAFAGSRDALSVAGSYRQQWTGFDGAPSTAFITGHSPLKNDALAVGVTMFRDEIGVSSASGFQGVFAYRMNLNQGKLSFGLNGGVSQIRNAWSNVITNEVTDDAFQSGDQSNWIPDFGAGIYYYTPKWFASVSMPTMVEITYGGGGDYTPEIQPGLSHLFLNSGVEMKMSPKWYLRPSVMLRYHASKTNQLDINAMMSWNETVEFGVSYRTSQAVIGVVRYFVNPQFSVGYSFDHELSDLSNYSGGSHELTLRYDLIFVTNSSNPRFF